ncbi:4Fe-4S dicluster domain-containing protein [Desulfobacterales bacterium HSG17]|nr:4Fe-4S dicluster domain-containing protein [Desulfobacterales bacterium HSG17]
MQKNLYRRLQEQLDQYSVGYPATESGIELELLKFLFSEDDAQLFQALTPMLESPDVVAERLARPMAEVAAQLDDMAERGLLFRLKKETSVRYGAIPFVHGIFEFQVKNLKTDFAKMARQYFEEAFDKAMQASADYFLRTIPVNQSIDITRNVAAYDDAVEILKSKPFIVVTDCICRKAADITTSDCGKPLEACFMFGSMGQYYLDREMGRKISLEEGISILEKCRDAGLVVQPATSQNPTGMCNCCGDCCGVLRALNQHPKPAEMVFSNYWAKVNAEDCTGCETCLERCQMEALKMTEDDIVKVDHNRCIGCGLCIATCPTEALKLVPKDDAEIRTPPATTAEQMLTMAQKRGIL